MSLILGCVACVLAVIVFVAAMLSLVFREHTSSQEEIDIGVLFNEANDLEREFLKTIHQSVGDIFEESQQRKRIVVYKRNISETEENAFDRLYKIGVRLYFGVSPDAAKKIAAKNITHDEVVLVPSPLYQPSTDLYHRSLQPDMRVTSSAYLSLINSSDDDAESIRVVPVMRDPEKKSGDDL